MKLTRIICLSLAWLWIAFVILIFMIIHQKASGRNTAYIIGTIVGSGIFMIPSFVLFFMARRITDKMEKKKREALMQSFDNI